MMDGMETTKYKQGEGDDEYDYSGEQEEEENRRRRRKRSTEDEDDYKDGEEEGGKYYGTDDEEIQLKACDLPICLAQPPEDDAGEIEDFPKNIQPPCIAVWTGITSDPTNWIKCFLIMKNCRTLISALSKVVYIHI